MNPLDVRLADKRRKLTIMMITSEDLTIFACKMVEFGKECLRSQSGC